MACRLYESEQMAALTGETLRPGGFTLTDEAVAVCGLAPGDAVLDLGCGRGATAARLSEKFGLEAVGVDPSDIMLAAARKQNSRAVFLQAEAERLPFENGRFDAVLAECVLSVTADPLSAVREAARVLKEGGFFAVSDVCAKNPEALGGVRAAPAGSCLRGMHDLDRFRDSLESAGFDIVSCADKSRYLDELLVKIIFEYGSLDAFLDSAAGLHPIGSYPIGSYPTGCSPRGGYGEKLRRCRPGYFLLIAKKNGGSYGR